MSSGETSQPRQALNVTRAEGACSLEEVIITAALSQRPARPPNYEEENKALTALMRGLARSPDSILQDLVNTAMRLGGAGSAGISVAEPSGAGDVVRWLAVAGALSPHVGGVFPRSFSPTGVVLERNAPVLMAKHSRYFRYADTMKPEALELLMVPFHVGDAIVGNLWLVSHTADKRFDLEDARILGSLCQFASAALQTLARRDTTAINDSKRPVGDYDREQIRNELAEVRRRLESTLAVAEVGTWTYDLRTNRVVADRNLAWMFGLSSADAQGGPIEAYLAAIHPDDRDSVEAHLATAVRDGATYETEYRLLASNGQARWVIARGYVERDAAGHAIGLPGVVVDVTRRVVAEQAHRELAAQLEQQATLFDTVLSTSPDFAYIFDLRGRFLYVNKPLLDLWGITLSQAVGKNFIDLKYPEALALKLQQQIQQVITTRERVIDETPYTSPAGVAGYYEYIFSPVFATDGAVQAVAGCTRVITDRKRMEDALLRASEEALAANRAKDRFLAVLSHELRTPLSPVVMTVPSIELDPELPGKFREDLAMVRRNIELEVTLIDDLLDLSRIASGKLLLQVQPVHVHEVLRHAIRNSSTESAAKSLAIREELLASNDQITGDPARLQQVFWNLVRNAVKFTPAGGDILVRTSNAAKDGQLVVEVKDSGVGIPAEALPKIFDAFEQGDTQRTREFGGLGLGLAIAKAVVEMHGGSISAASDGQAHGATFTVRFARLGSGQIAETTAPQKGESATPEPVSRAKVLLVEDHPDTVRILARLLRGSGYDVKTAHSVASALELADTEPFDVVVSDIGLPDATGYELMAQIKDRYGIKGIALSGYGMEEDLRRSREAGFVEHVIKPINIEHLQAVINRVTKAATDNRSV